MASTRGRSEVISLTNKSGGAVAAGDVVVIDTANDTAFTTTTTGRAEVSIGIAQEAIANNAPGRVLVSGYAALINVPASVTRGHYIETHTVAKQATGNSTRRSGSFGQFFTGGTTPTGWLWGSTDQTAAAAGGMATDTLWNAAGDLAYGTGSDTGARLGIGTAGHVLTVNGGATAPEWAAAGGSGAYALHEEQVAGAGGLASFDFTSIPGTARHIVIEVLSRSEKSANFDTMLGRFNNDSSAVYNQQKGYTFGTTTGAEEQISQTSFVSMAEMPAASATSGLFSYTKITIPYYANTFAHKIASSESFEPLNTTTGSGRQTKYMALHWRSTSAITRVTLFTAANDWAENSSASMYLID